MSENRFQNYEENQAQYLVETLGRLTDHLAWLDPFYQEVARYSLNHLDLLNKIEESLRDDRLCEELLESFAEEKNVELFSIFMFLHKKRYR